MADTDRGGDDDGRAEPETRIVAELLDDAEGEGDVELAAEVEKVSAELGESSPEPVVVEVTVALNVADASRDADDTADCVAFPELGAVEVDDTEGDGVVDFVD